MTTTYHAPSHPGLSYPAFVDPQSPGQPPGRPPGRSRAPGSVDPSTLPRVDDQIVTPETREELVRGRAVVAMPAKEPHAERQAEVVSVIQRSTAEGYIGATELLTRAGPQSDFATDACVRRKGIDPATGGRYLEELAFEIVSEQSKRDITERAQDLTRRGARRLIAIFVKTNEVREWSLELDDWITLDPDGAIEDHTLVRPIPIRALLDHAKADDAVAQALLAKNNPVLLALQEKGLEQGRARMARKAIEALCEILDIPLEPERQALLQEMERKMDAAALEALHDGIRAKRRWP